MSLPLASGGSGDDLISMCAGRCRLRQRRSILAEKSTFSHCSKRSSRYWRESCISGLAELLPFQMRRATEFRGTGHLAQFTR